MGPVVLRTLGRNWTDPIAVEKETFEIVLPKPRVALRFDVVTSDAPEQPLAQIVVYPMGHRLAWNEKIPLYVDADAPAWFHEWLTAVGVPATVIKSGSVIPHEKPGLFVIGRTAAGKTAEELAERRKQWQCPVLVLDAEWFSEANPEKVPVAGPPDQFGHALKRLNQYSWPRTLEFQNVAGPWLGVANRFVWIDGPSSPLVERIHTAGKGQLVLSYLSWPQQLGLETADSILITILNEAARQDAGVPQLGREFVLLWPPAESVTSKSRPVLFTALRERGTVSSADMVREERRSPVSILDLRGPSLAESEAAMLPPVAPDADWIVLGGDRSVTIPQEMNEGHPVKDCIVRLTDDALPSNRRQQVRLMQALSDQGVYFGTLTTTRREP